MKQVKRFFDHPLVVVAVCLVMMVAFLRYVPAPAHAGEYGVKASVTGGSPQQLAATLNTAGYTGRNQLDELTICNPTGNAASVYRGQSNVSASNGFELPPGVCKTWRLANPQRPIDITRIYLFTASTQSVAVDLHSAD